MDLKAIVKRAGRSPELILKIAKRLGLRLRDNGSDQIQLLEPN